MHSTRSLGTEHTGADGGELGAHLLSSVYALSLCSLNIQFRLTSINFLREDGLGERTREALSGTFSGEWFRAQEDTCCRVFQPLQ